MFVGHRIKSVEVRKLKEDWDVIIKSSNFDATERICKDRKWVNTSNMSLAKLTEIVLGYSLDGKDGNVNERNSDWTKLLTIRQKVYAARDGLLSSTSSPLNSNCMHFSSMGFCSGLFACFEINISFTISSRWFI
jgi:hypothetical protein